MSIVIAVKGRDTSLLQKTISSALGDVIVETWPEVADPLSVETLVLWNHPEGIIDEFPKLNLICSMGAGVDHIFADPCYRQDIAVTRVVDPELTVMMRKYVVMGVTSLHKQLFSYYHRKIQKQWFETFPSDGDPVVGVMGLGELGRDVAIALKQLGYSVTGWSRTPKNLSGIKCYTGKELADFVSGTNILVCMLPLTTATEGILNLDLFAQMPEGSYLINVGRGRHLVDKDLILAIENGKIIGAMLDVFNEEPLPANHRFWDFPEIILTPHIASITNQRNAGKQIAENHLRRQKNLPLLNRADPSLGY